MRFRRPSLMRQVALREWQALCVLMLTATVALALQTGLGRLDQALYDMFLSASTRPAREDVIIVAIDDYSLAELGRWPWPRNRHAELLRQLSASQPKAVGLDIILSETSPDDRLLADAMHTGIPTVLPVVLTSIGMGPQAGLPAPLLASAANAMGHINLRHDADGVVRSVFLYEGDGANWWPHFSLALQGIRHITVHGTEATGLWQRQDEANINYAGGVGHFRSVPYVSVLRGEVPAAFFKDKYVLVGATALGMADAYPTPVSGGSGAMPGIEINANILAASLDRAPLRNAVPVETVAFAVIPVLFALLGYLFLSPRRSLLLVATLGLATLVASYFALRHGVWLPPAVVLIVLGLSYPLWSWRRLEAVIGYLGREFSRLDKEPHLLPEADARTPGATRVADVLQQRIDAMRTAARRVRDLRQFVSDNLDNLPDATFVTTMDGRVLLKNRHAHDLCAATGLENRAGFSVFTLLATFSAPQPLEGAANTSFAWSELLDLQAVGKLAGGIAVTDEYGRDLLVRSAPSYSAANVLTGWIVSIADISTIRAAERSRDETLRFLSHDMRAPQASILALLELQTEPASALPQQEFFNRIEKASRKTLGLADNFVQLARAESQEYRLEEMDFHDLLIDATDEMWSLAKNKRIGVELDASSGEYPILGDRALLTRALTNLLSNAINYSPEGSTIRCTLQPLSNGHDRSPEMACSIADQGYGIAEADQNRLFRRFQRFDLPDQPRHEGIGLGLVFVKTVIERHGGSIGFTSKAAQGTTFTVVLPCGNAAETAPSAVPRGNTL